MFEFKEQFSQISNFDFISEGEEQSYLIDIYRKTDPQSDNSAKLIQKKRRRIHTKYHTDNIKRKINVKYFNFLIEFINKIIKETIADEYIEDKMKFCDFNYQFKKNVTSNYFDNLKQNSIISFLVKDKNVINKGKGFNNYNYSVYNLIINKNPNLKDILNKNCYDFFPIFYTKSIEFSFDQRIIDLSEMNCFYEDVLKNNNSNDEKYITNMENVINKYFLKKEIKKEIKFVVQKGPRVLLI